MSFLVGADQLPHDGRGQVRPKLVGHVARVELNFLHERALLYYIGKTRAE